MTAQSKTKLNKFGVRLGCGMFILSILLFGLGLDFLKAEVFPHYFNSQKHVIVQQNPDTKEIYAWKDASGSVYTPADSQVKNFSWGATALLLLVMLFGATVYSVAIKAYTKNLLQREPQIQQNTVPRLQ